MQLIRFDSRDLKPYAEPVEAAELMEGQIYFFLNFIDDKMFLPTLEPMIFIGRNLNENDICTVYFQDTSSYDDGVRYNSFVKGQNAVFYSGLESEIGHIFEFENALNELMKCSIRRKGKYDWPDPMRPTT